MCCCTFRTGFHRGCMGEESQVSRYYTDKKKRTVKLMSNVDLRWFTLTDRPTSNLTAVLDGCMPDVVGIFDSGPEEEKTNTHATKQTKI